MNLQNKTNDELARIIMSYADADLKNKAGEQLRQQVGVTQPVDEEALIKEIAVNVLARHRQS